MVAKWVSILTAATGTVGLITALMVSFEVNSNWQKRYNEQIERDKIIIENQQKELEMLRELLKRR